MINCEQCSGSGKIRLGPNELEARCVTCQGLGFQKLTWGLTPPARKHIAWGARAIFSQGYVDIVWDRTQMVGGTDEERARFSTFLAEFGVPELRKLVTKEKLDPRDRTTVSTQLGQWCIVCDPKASYGYLYIGVYPVDGVEMPEGYVPKKEVKKSGKRSSQRSHR